MSSLHWIPSRKSVTNSAKHLFTNSQTTIQSSSVAISEFSKYIKALLAISRAQGHQQADPMVETWLRRGVVGASWCFSSVRFGYLHTLAQAYSLTTLHWPLSLINLPLSSLVFHSFQLKRLKILTRRFTHNLLLHTRVESIPTQQYQNESDSMLVNLQNISLSFFLRDFASSKDLSICLVRCVSFEVAYILASIHHAASCVKAFSHTFIQSYKTRPGNHASWLTVNSAILWYMSQNTNSPCIHSHGVPPRDMMIVVPTGYINSASRVLYHYHQPSQALDTMSTEYAKLANLPALESGTSGTCEPYHMTLTITSPALSHYPLEKRIPHCHSIVYILRDNL